MTNWTELKRLAEMASEGTWNFAQHDDCAFIEDSCGQFICSDADHIHDSEFIAAANPKTILALIAENEDQKLQTEAARAVCLESQDSILSLIAERDQIRAEVEALRELLRDSCEAIRHGEFSTGICCCGSSVDSHGFGDGHSPVDEGDYYASGLIERIDSALKANT